MCVCVRERVYIRVHELTEEIHTENAKEEIRMIRRQNEV